MGKMKSSDLPNILIFMADEMRGDCISLDGEVNSVIKTPNLDKFADDGVTFTKCFTVNPVCVPSRCCTFTGQYVHSNNHRSLYQLLRSYEENLFKFLKEKGYEVIWIGRNDLFNKEAIKESVTKRIHIGGKINDNPWPKDHPLRKSFLFGERAQEQSRDSDYKIIRKAMKFLDSEPENPFCLYLAMNFPHPPYTVENPYFAMYDRNKTIPIPAKLNDKPEFMKLMHERYGLNSLSKEDFREIRATYYGMISRLDAEFGEVIEKLKEIGDYEKTAIFFTSDHGDFAGDYGLTEKWPNAFQDCLVRIPLIIKIPEITPNQKKIDQLVQNIDLFPTIMSIAKVDSLYTHFGKNLIPLIRGSVKSLRKEVFSEGGYNPREPQCFEIIIPSPDVPVAGVYYDKTNLPTEKPGLVARSVMIRTNLWKLILRDHGKEELYDMIYDPNEVNNLIDVHGYEKVITDLKERLLRWYLRTSDNADWKRARHV
jgi:choline-sulfatase